MQMPAVIARHKIIVGLSLVVLTAVLIFVAWAFIALHTSFSEGTRAGYLQKISKRGWVCKTWEGDLQAVAVPGVAPEIFRFTTRSDSLAAEMDKLAGKPVVLTYKQRKGVPTSCFGDTEYFVVGVRAGGAP